jgi:hypothetical protein
MIAHAVPPGGPAPSQDSPLAGRPPPRAPLSVASRAPAALACAARASVVARSAGLRRPVLCARPVCRAVPVVADRCSVHCRVCAARARPSRRLPHGAGAVLLEQHGQHVAHRTGRPLDSATAASDSADSSCRTFETAFFIGTRGGFRTRCAGARSGEVRASVPGPRRPLIGQPSASACGAGRDRTRGAIRRGPARERARAPSRRPPVPSDSC